MSKKKMVHQRKLGFEGLEQRTLLTVTAILSGTELRVTGDELDNHIDIIQAGAGAFDVSEDVAGFLGAFTGVASIRVELKAGNDNLHITGDDANPLTGDLNIKAGLGDDSVFLGEDFVDPTTPLDVDGDVTIETSDGNDSVHILPGSNFGENLTVNTGHQDDDLMVVGSLTAPITVGGRLTLNTSEGNDGDVTMQTGGIDLGDIFVDGDAVIETSDGDDVVKVGGTSFFSQKFSVNSGHGNDFVQIGNGTDAISIAGRLVLNTSVGDDILIVQLLNTGPGPATLISTSDGQDFVTIRDSSFASLDVNTGLDNDSLVFEAAVFVVGNANLNGSQGTSDLLDDTGLTVFGTRTTKAFETII